ncbi:MAG: electron transfer flavoprotein subunit beta/FixA family protein [Lentisphaeria bacterium]|nr:electron transfer flavoprotein subunit beta/FixA family protein [Lentisphaeria bacterium]
MKIAICIKQVPGTTAVEVDPVTGTLKRDGVESKLNPCDLYALETALRLKESCGASLTAVTMGPPQAQSILREAFMMGVDEAVLVSDRKFGGSDVLSTSYTLAQALECAGPFDLIICGRQTTDGDTAQVGSELAELLHIPHAANVIKIRSLEEKQLQATVLLPGCRMQISMQLPALIAVDESIAEPRLPSYKLKLATADRKIKLLSLKDFTDTDESHYGQSGSPTRVVRVFPPEHNTRQERWEGSGQENALRLAAFLEEGKFLQNPR